jgi:hypothetical protein
MAVDEIHAPVCGFDLSPRHCAVNSNLSSTMHALLNRPSSNEPALKSMHGMKKKKRKSSTQVEQIFRTKA